MNFEKTPNKKPNDLARKERLRQRAIENKRIQVARQRKRLVSICALITLFVASVLLFTVAIFELTIGDKYVYLFNSEEKSFDKSDILENGVQYVDMNSLADLCSLEVTPLFSSRIYRINGTEIILEDGSDSASVNSLSVKLSAPVKLKDDYCFVPLADIVSVIPALSASELDGKTQIKLNSDKDGIYIMASGGFDVQYTTDISAYLEYINTTDRSVLILANKSVVLGESYTPPDLVEIPAELRKNSVIYLSLPAEMALEAMMQDMRALGFSDVYVTSAYRSFEYQKGLFDKYVDQEMSSGLSYEAAVDAVLAYSAAPGTSEHQTGLCIDFTTVSIGGVVDDAFETTSVFRWLSENAWKYGFIMRYPKDKVDITGYQYESWHYRFVGLETAAKIHQCGLCYEEYYDLFIK